MNGLLVTFAILAAISIAAFSFIKFKSSSDWHEVNGLISHSEVKKVYNSHPHSAGGDNTFDYELVIEYKYDVNGKSYIGNKLFAGGIGGSSNILSESYLVDEYANKYKAGSSALIYYHK